MSLGQLLRKIFGAGRQDEPGEAVEYKGCLIRPAPRPQGGQFYLAGVITKSFPDGVKEHRFVRADTFASRDDACASAIVKARQIIDERGDTLFSDG